MGFILPRHLCVCNSWGERQLWLIKLSFTFSLRLLQTWQFAIVLRVIENVRKIRQGNHFLSKNHCPRVANSSVWAAFCQFCHKTVFCICQSQPSHSQAPPSLSLPLVAHWQFVLQIVFNTFVFLPHDVSGNLFLQQVCTLPRLGDLTSVADI